MEKKQNCWEYMKCELGPGGKNVAEKGLCPAATNENLNGINGGINGGRTCWVVSETLCNDTCQKDFVSKCMLCMNCEFYINTYREEKFPQEKSTKELLKKAMGQNDKENI